MASAAQGGHDSLAAFVVSGDAGSVIYKTGDKSTDLYVIQRGQIELIDDRSGRGRLALLELGDFFGERGLFERQPRDHTARAATPYALVRLDWPTFQAVVHHRPDVALNMLRIVSRRQVFESRAAPSGPTATSPAAAEVALVHTPSGGRYRLGRDAEAIVGRRDKVTGFVPDIDLTDLDGDRTLSRRHLRIAWRDDAWFAVEATKTANGSFVNGQKLEVGVPVMLRNGDRVQLGDIELVFQG
jgi:CRP-like cAMP-binding protein